jgi:hypothetical protein
LFRPLRVDRECLIGLHEVLRARGLSGRKEAVPGSESAVSDLRVDPAKQGRHRDPEHRLDVGDQVR